MATEPKRWITLGKHPERDIWFVLWSDSETGAVVALCPVAFCDRADAFTQGISVARDLSGDPRRMRKHAKWLDVSAHGIRVDRRAESLTGDGSLFSRLCTELRGSSWPDDSRG